MFDLFRTSAKINRLLGIIIVLLSIFSMFFPDKTSLSRYYTAVFVTAVIGALSWLSGFIAKKKLMVVSDEIDFNYPLVRRICWGISISLLIISIIGLALGFSTGTISYIYIALIPAMILYIICLFTTKVSFEEEEVSELGFIDMDDDV